MAKENLDERLFVMKRKLAQDHGCTSENDNDCSVTVCNMSGRLIHDCSNNDIKDQNESIADSTGTSSTKSYYGCPPGCDCDVIISPTTDSNSGPLLPLSSATTISSGSSATTISSWSWIKEKISNLVGDSGSTDCIVSQNLLAMDLYILDTASKMEVMPEKKITESLYHLDKLLTNHLVEVGHFIKSSMLMSMKKILERSEQNSTKCGVLGLLRDLWKASSREGRLVIIQEIQEELLLKTCSGTGDTVLDEASASLQRRYEEP